MRFTCNIGVKSSLQERERNFMLAFNRTANNFSCVAVKTLPLNTDVEIKCVAVL